MTLERVCPKSSVFIVRLPLPIIIAYFKKTYYYCYVPSTYYYLEKCYGHDSMKLVQICYRHPKS
jgi:hypothetical protein